MMLGDSPVLTGPFGEGCGEQSRECPLSRVTAIVEVLADGFTDDGGHAAGLRRRHLFQTLILLPLDEDLHSALKH